MVVANGLVPTGCQDNYNQQDYNTERYFHENPFENVVSQITTILP